MNFVYNSYLLFAKKNSIFTKYLSHMRFYKNTKYLQMWLRFPTRPLQVLAFNHVDKDR